ncbi:BlaI/MecI/CopY family transcriptional regulator [Kitasatospora aureofaciens]|uniref:BlaI/MecI/CopY family transcriptional regulator n=1 Tax=Kitasatospora aureofaciens TaxID=1894 RepID=UPI001C4931D8|nr:BlaI/MecI/CopY family transcriptional regulator [Kitasatospora aureofaciens]MBV6696873.1 BlaI/MecI/CopY family transcriptional regulator [Kitasatospora aureofaciens]
MGGRRREHGALEAEVMAVLWAEARPMTATEVHEALGDPGLVYKTVLTVLGRLHAKGLLDRERSGRAHAYVPRRGPADEVASQMNQALARGADRMAVLQHFVAGLDPEDERALRDLLDAGE